MNHQSAKHRKPHWADKALRVVASSLAIVAVFAGLGSATPAQASPDREASASCFLSPHWRADVRAHWTAGGRDGATLDWVEIRSPGALASAQTEGINDQRMSRLPTGSAYVDRLEPHASGSLVARLWVTAPSGLGCPVMIPIPES